MDDFEEREIRDRLQRFGGHRPDSDAAYARLQRGVRLARRRRSVSILSGLGITVVLAFSAAVYANRSNSSVSPADGGTDAEVTTGNSERATDDTATESTPHTSDGDDTSGSANTLQQGNPSGNGSTSVPSGGNGPANQLPPATTTAVASQVDETKTGVSQGGSITVSVHGGVLTLFSHTATDGYSYELEDSEDTRIRVRFENSGGHSRIEATIAANGHISFAVSESYSGSDDTSQTSSP